MLSARNGFSSRRLLIPRRWYNKLRWLTIKLLNSYNMMSFYTLLLFFFKKIACHSTGIKLQNRFVFAYAYGIAWPRVCTYFFHQQRLIVKSFLSRCSCRKRNMLAKFQVHMSILRILLMLFKLLTMREN